MLPLASQRASSRRATAMAHGLSQGLPSASAAETAAATVAESISVTASEARRVASRLLVAAATTAVSPGPSTLACAPSKRRLITAMAGRPAPPWAASAAPALHTSPTSGVIRMRV